ncbi:EAL domain-containing protein [Vibrio hepatarius]|uniref:EAL domain-containing protein n=1 Tax=Vibrio hepatarius TaxID=171383 RepID=UPI001C08567C|nr:EAL domain-containing protein [Vibrio hepatarius]MBU2897753.1 EAL domain-containing protein [Vibrio hepatarius]
MGKQCNDSDELLPIIEDVSEADVDTTQTRYWRVLIVDDDEEVHHATELALKDLIVEDRPLELLHAYSAKHAKSILCDEADIGVILLDVVMETEHAGLELVEMIRDELDMHALRIILRTGQPGYAPEMETIQRYDINDYRTKPELTRIRLFTILTSSIRAYNQIRSQQIMRQGLEKVVKASTELAHLHGMQMFAEGAVKQISAIMQIEPDGLICAQETQDDKVVGPIIIAASGRYSNFVQTSLDTLDSEHIRKSIIQCLETKTSLLEQGLTLYFSTERGRGVAAYVDVRRPLENIDKHLLEVFCANLSVGFDNVILYNRLEEQAFKDPLLDIANLNSLRRYHYTGVSRDDFARLALIDIDDFSSFNDSFGHSAGDGLLVRVSIRLQKHFPYCFLARVGSDVFALLGSHRDIISDRIMSLFESSFTVDEQPFKITASIGIVDMMDQDFDPSVHYKDAQVALKQAKLYSRGGAVSFSADMGQDARDRMHLLAELKQALNDNALFMTYQPKYKLATLELSGVEALLRWRNKEGVLVPPDQFIPLAEQSGLMVSIGAFVLEHCCLQFQMLKQAGHTQLTMAINVSPTQIEGPGFVQQLRQTMKRYNIEPETVELEVTETVVAKNISELCKVLNKVRQLGCKIAIDDFGTGFSSLSVLHTLPATRLKIDRAFVEGMLQDDSIAKMIVNLGQTLGMEITAEGIENKSQLERLKGFGCEEGQGWLFSKAMIMEELLNFARQVEK